MGNALLNIPAESILLCETCGYVLTGLPQGGRCPECGSETAESSPAHRGLPAWELPGILPLKFISTTGKVLFHPRRFYRTLITRRERRYSIGFAMIHWLLASLLFGVSIYVHMAGFIYFDIPIVNKLLHSALTSTAIFAAITFLMFALTTPLAARLTSWEARYRGLRLPLAVVRRGLDYHAADYLPVALVSCATIVGYRWLIDHGHLDSTFDAKYLYFLCGEVIAGAAYLFNAYWIGMRNMMYANG